MAMEEGKAGCGLLGRGVAILRRPPVEHVGDVDLASVQADAGEHLIQELPGAADKGKTLLVLVASGGLADQHDPARWRAVGENGVLRRPLQLAALEIAQRR